MRLTSEQMLMIFGVLSFVFLTRFIKGVTRLDEYADNPDLRKKAIDYALENGTLFSLNFAVVVLVLLIDHLRLFQ